MSALGDRLATLAKNIGTWIREERTRAIGWLFGGIASFLFLTIVILPIWNSLAGPSAYVVYLVGDFSDPTLANLRAGFEKSKKDLQINHVNISFVALDAKASEAKVVSARLAEQNDTLMVAGHLNTTPSADALPNYLRAHPPIPVVLPIETNPELLPADHTKYYPVFRLSPTDDKQAEKAADFAVRNGNGIWVIEDETTNPVYTRYLANEFVKQVRTKSESNAAIAEQDAEFRNSQKTRLAANPTVTGRSDSAKPRPVSGSGPTGSSGGQRSESDALDQNSGTSSVAGTPEGFGHQFGFFRRVRRELSNSKSASQSAPGCCRSQARNFIEQYMRRYRTAQA